MVQGGETAVVRRSDFVRISDDAWAVAETLLEAVTRLLDRGKTTYAEIDREAAALGVSSRAIVGLYVTLESPSTLSIGLALQHAVMPKQPWLESRGITAPWKVHGLPDLLHFDNAKEFRSYALRYFGYQRADRILRRLEDLMRTYRRSPPTSCHTLRFNPSEVSSCCSMISTKMGWRWSIEWRRTGPPNCAIK